MVTIRKRSVKIHKRESVLKAIKEFDRLGREDFLEKYGYKHSIYYFLIHKGRTYDSKPIVAVAYGYENPDSGYLCSWHFNGGASTVKPILEKLDFKVKSTQYKPVIEKNAVAPDSYAEGSVQTVVLNKYERNQRARTACIDHWGLNCGACEINFEAMYGKLGRGFIHVHHLRDIALVGKKYQVNPIKDLRPVCPNCHAMLHRKTPAMSIKHLRKLIEYEMPSG